MSIRVTNLRLAVDEPEAALPTRIARALGVHETDVQHWRILRKSLDTRDKRAIQFVYSAEVRVPADENTVLRNAKPQPPIQLDLYDEPPFEIPPFGTTPLPHRPIVLGSGPAGLVAAYFLARYGYRPLLLERGTRVNDRIRDVKTFDDGGAFHPESNYLFGEGGAGTFSDGKLTCRGSGPDVMRVLELFAECKGKPSILYEHRPHLGSNRLPAVVKAIRQRIEDFGGEVRFLCRVEDIVLNEGRIEGVTTSSGFIPTNLIVLAPGHSARDTFEMLHARGIPMQRKAFQFGVRIEHTQETINRVQYGSNRLEERLGSADYTLVAHGKNDVFTFCMCAGGYIIPSVSQEGYFCTNGMSLSKRDSPFANSGLVVTVPVEQFMGTHVLGGMHLQMHYERIAYEMGRGNYGAPMQSASDYLGKKASKSLPKHSYPRTAIPCDLREVLPPFIADALQHGLPQLDRRWHGRFIANAVLAGPESRGSSPIRIVRNDDSRESPGISGLYPIGEGAGYAGGIVSAAVDGLRSAKAIIARYAPLESAKIG